MIIRNAIQTPDGTILESFHVHDCKSHTDANGKTYMVDGGLEYLRRGGHGDELDLSLNSEASHDVQRENLTWGSYGKEGNSPLKRIKIKDMETDHIEAVLRECAPRKVLRDCMNEELKRRSDDASVS